MRCFKDKCRYMLGYMLEMEERKKKGAGIPSDLGCSFG